MGGSRSLKADLARRVKRFTPFPVCFLTSVLAVEDISSQLLVPATIPAPYYQTSTRPSRIPSGTISQKKLSPSYVSFGCDVLPQQWRSNLCTHTLWSSPRLALVVAHTCYGLLFLWQESPGC